MADKKNKRTLNFKTEVSQLLNLMIHSLYSNRDIFLRELISNASDALDKLRFLAISDEKLNEGDSDYKIIVVVDKENKSITIEDNGIGMDEEEVIANIGTIANSGTKKFLEKLDKGEIKDSNMIGQFGVGFYACFMVADQVSLETRRAGEQAENGVLWSSNGDGKFSLQVIPRPSRGTKITLHLRDDATEYADEWKIKEIINQYSDHISFPVMMPEKVQEESVEEGNDESKDKKAKDSKQKKSTTEKTELKNINSAEALWLKSPRSIKKEEYEAFYKGISYDFEGPLVHMHNRVEGTLEYSSVLFIPKKAPFDLFDREQKRGLKLYVKRVFIMDESESLLPNWLRFVRGVVDCADIPLNVSREILQDNKIVRKIRAALVKRILNKMEEMAKNTPDDFKILWGEFGQVIKEGTIEDHENKEKIAALLRFASTENDQQEVTLSAYVERMQENQESIFYLCAESLEAAKSSPHLELFKEKGIEVLLLSDRIDEWVSAHLTEFEGKKLRAVNRDDGQEELSKIATKELGDDAETTAEEVIDCKALLEKLKKSLGDRVADVKESKRLRTSPCCVVMDNAQMTHNMQKIMQAMGQEIPDAKPILEINPSHRLLAHINDLKNADFDEWATLLLDQALLSEGAQLTNPGEFVARMNKLLVGTMTSQ